METVQLGQTDYRISRLGLGGCPLGGHGWGEFDRSQAVEAVKKSLELGINFFDTADIYGLGQSEELLAETLGTQRQKVIIASKFGVRFDPVSKKTYKDISPQYVRQALEASLKRLRVETIPLYYVHWSDGRTPIQDTVAELEKCRQEGKIRAVGLSNFSAAEIETAVQIAPIAAVQVQFSLLEQEQARMIFNCVKRHRISLITWGSLAQGLLSGKYDENTCFSTDDRRCRDTYPNFHGDKLAQCMDVVRKVKEIAGETSRTPVQIALRWLLDTEPVASVLFGAKNPKQAEDNCRAADWKLSIDSYQILLNESRKINSSVLKWGGGAD